MLFSRFSLRISDGHEPMTFSSDNEIMEWFRNEQLAWAALLDSSNVPSPIRSQLQTLHNDFEYIKNTLDNYALSPNDEHRISQAISALRVFEMPEAHLLPSESREGQRVLDILQNHGKTEAVAAFLVATKRLSLGQAFEASVFRGAVLYTLPHFESTLALTQVLEIERSKMRDRHRRVLADANAKVDKVLESCQTAADDLAGRFEEMVGSQTLTFQSDQEARAAQFDALKAALNSTQKYYEEKMALLAPVRYWSNKHRNHSKRLCYSIFGLIGYFALAGASLYYTFFSAYNVLIERAADIPPTTVIIVSGGLALFSTLVLWIGRLVSRYFNSQQHLANDAHERRVMTMTYLALTKNGAASAEDRAIILNALFRPSSDGIVRDDGSPDTPLAQALRLVSPNTGRQQ